MFLERSCINTATDRSMIPIYHFNLEAAQNETCHVLTRTTAMPLICPLFRLTTLSLLTIRCRSREITPRCRTQRRETSRRTNRLENSRSTRGPIRRSNGWRTRSKSPSNNISEQKSDAMGFEFTNCNIVILCFLSFVCLVSQEIVPKPIQTVLSLICNCP